MRNSKNPLARSIVSNDDSEPAIIANYGNHVVRVNAAMRRVLGTMPDHDVASMFGITCRRVQLARIALNINAFVPDRFQLSDEHIALLGTVTDSVAAERIGRSPSWVRDARIHYNIKPEAVKHKHSRYRERIFEAINVSSSRVTATSIASEIGVSNQYVSSISDGVFSTPLFDLLHETLTMLGPQTWPVLKKILSKYSKITSIGGYVVKGYLATKRVPGEKYVYYFLTGKVPKRFRGVPINQGSHPKLMGQDQSCAATVGQRCP